MTVPVRPRDVSRGTYPIPEGTVGAFLPVEAFEPAGVPVAVVSGLGPTGLAASLAWAERLLGALLVVPFALLVVGRLRSYIGTATSEEGLAADCCRGCSGSE